MVRIGGPGADGGMTTLRSMTGFGVASGESDRYRIGAAVRSVNHRNLDLSIRLLQSLREAEAPIRALLQSRLSRGRLDLTVDVESVLPSASEVRVDRRLIDELTELSRSLGSGDERLSALGIGDLLRIPGVVEVRRRDEEWLDGDQKLLVSVVEEALEQLVGARETEGRALVDLLTKGLGRLAALAEQLAEGRAEAIAELETNLRKRVTRLLEGVPLDEARLAQEVAHLVERSDVTEEIDRLFAHVAHAATVLEGESPAGKRLDFLLQEVQRELNTLGAKCRDIAMSRVVVDGKAACEQLREQVQNVE